MCTAIRILRYREGGRGGTSRVYTSLEDWKQNRGVLGFAYVFGHFDVAELLESRADVSQRPLEDSVARCKLEVQLVESLLVAPDRLREVAGREAVVAAADAHLGQVAHDVRVYAALRDSRAEDLQPAEHAGVFLRLVRAPVERQPPLEQLDRAEDKLLQVEVD